MPESNYGRFEIQEEEKNKEYDRRWKELLERNRQMHAPESGYDDLRKIIQRAEKILCK